MNQNELNKLYIELTKQPLQRKHPWYESALEYGYGLIGDAVGGTIGGTIGSIGGPGGTLAGAGFGANQGEKYLKKGVHDLINWGHKQDLQRDSDKFWNTVKKGGVLIDNKTGQWEPASNIQKEGQRYTNTMQENAKRIYDQTQQMNKNHPGMDFRLP